MLSSNLSQQTTLEDRLDRIEALLQQALDRRHVDPDIVTWRAAAERLGIVGKSPDQAARRRVLRARDAGASMRITRNGIMQADFKRWVADLTLSRPSRAEIVRAALRGAKR